ncbi:hypothetical protein D3C71_1960600 [compost metagenome]
MTSLESARVMRFSSTGSTSSTLLTFISRAAEWRRRSANSLPKMPSLSSDVVAPSTREMLVKSGR